MWLESSCPRVERSAPWRTPPGGNCLDRVRVSLGALVHRGQALFLLSPPRRNSYFRLLTSVAKISFFQAEDQSNPSHGFQRAFVSGPSRSLAYEFERNGKRNPICFVCRQEIPPAGILEAIWTYLLKVILEEVWHAQFISYLAGGGRESQRDTERGHSSPEKCHCRQGREGSEPWANALEVS